MRSRSHQGMLSPSVKKLPTDSKKRPIFASIESLVGLRSQLGSGEEGAGEEGCSRLVAFVIRLDGGGGRIDECGIPFVIAAAWRNGCWCSGGGGGGGCPHRQMRRGRVSNGGVEGGTQSNGGRGSRWDADTRWAASGGRTHGGGEENA
jgi:hypothetical protein